MSTKIAILEDDLTMRSLLETLLHLEGFQILLLNPDDEASVIRQIQQASAQVLLLDVHLKNFNGIDIVRAVRKFKPSMDDPIIVMASGMDLKKECLTAGANYFLLKPYMPQELINWLKNAVE